MSIEYDLYLEQHRKAVRDGLRWISEKLPKLLINNDIWRYEWQIASVHDRSKESKEEYAPYDAYFYSGEITSEVKKRFDYAWLHHIHSNKHHWQYWVLINDDPNEGEIVMDMPKDYIIEMICDWWSFSWQCGDLYEMLKWYDDRKNYIKLSEKTRKHVEHILSEIKRKLDELKELGYDLGKPDNA